MDALTRSPIAPAPPVAPLAAVGLRPRGRPLEVALDQVGPAWFTSVMGTGILAIGFALSPLRLPAFAALGRGLFVLDLGLFAAFVALWLAHVVRDPAATVATFRDPVRAQPWGAPPMACFTLCVGFLAIGTAFLPRTLCISLAQGLWLTGVGLAVLSATVVPYLMVTTHELTPADANGAWLLPVVPPIVASVPAALLAPTWPEALRPSALAIGYGLLGTGTALAAVLIVVFYARLLWHKVPEDALVMTMWLVVGPLGQSVAGMIALGTAARAVWPQLGVLLFGAGVAYGMLTWGFGVFWLGLALAVTLRASRKGISFTLGWWALTFPVGTLISGSDQLYGATGATLFALGAAGLLALLTVTWSVVASGSLRHARRAAQSITPRPR